MSAISLRTHIYKSRPPIYKPTIFEYKQILSSRFYMKITIFGIDKCTITYFDNHHNFILATISVGISYRNINRANIIHFTLITISSSYDTSICDKIQTEINSINQTSEPVLFMNTEQCIRNFSQIIWEKCFISDS